MLQPDDRWHVNLGGIWVLVALEAGVRASYSGPLRFRSQFISLRREVPSRANDKCAFDCYRAPDIGIELKRADWGIIVTEVNNDPNLAHGNKVRRLDRLIACLDATGGSSILVFSIVLAAVRIEMLRLGVFVSSPGDVGPERGVALAVAERLQFEFRGQVKLDTYLWERSMLRATDSFQTQILDIRQADLALFILWSRLGTPLPPDLFKRDDETPYASGTEYEFERAREGYHAAGHPEIVCYIKTAEVRLSVRDRELQSRQVEDLGTVHRFTDKWFRNADGSFKSAYFTFEKTAQFEDLVEAHLRDWIRKRLNAAETSLRPSQLWRGSPFRGLKTFDFEHALIYCGRTGIVAEVIEVLRRRAIEGRGFLMVTGMSGVGKSSLLRAGVLPLLTRPGVVENVECWRRSVFSTDAGNQRLLEGFVTALLEPEALPELAKVKGFAIETLRDAAALTLAIAEALDEVTKAARERSVEPNAQGEARLIILCDQFEAIFDETVSPEQRTVLVEALRTAVMTKRVWVIAALRADFFDRCAELPENFRDLFIERGGLMTLGGPRPADISQMIRRPAAMAGLTFERRGDSDEGLDDVLRDAAVGNPTVLPLLEFTLDELWRRSQGSGILRFSDYEELGGLRGALRLRAEEVYTGLSAPVQALLPRILAAIVHIDPTDERLILQSKVSLDQFSSSPECRVLINAFVAAHLFVADRTPEGSAIIGLAHEALLREWPPAVEWIENNRGTLRLRSGIAAAAALWKNGEKREGLLLSRALLRDSVKLLATNPEALAAYERDYIEISLRQDRRRLKRMISYGSLAAAIVAAVITLSVIGVSQINYALSVAYAAPTAWSQEQNIPLSPSALDNLNASITNISTFLASQLKDRQQHPELTAWALAQMWVALHELQPALTGHELREAVNVTKDAACHCWKETDDQLPHSMATAWVLFALGVYREPIAQDELVALLDRQAPAGWWSMYPARLTDGNASTAATAFIALSLHQQLKENLISPELIAKATAAMSKASEWLALRAIPGKARWTEYPPSATYEHNVEFLAVSGLVIHVLRAVNGSSQFDAAWLNNLPQTVPVVWQNEAAKAYVFRSDTQMTLDDVRHYQYPWMLRATIDAYPRGDMLEKARALVWLEKALERPITAKELRFETWTGAETLFALRHAQAVLHPQPK
jgi:hypothetical protein